jgi:hypothetical protein
VERFTDSACSAQTGTEGRLEMRNDLWVIGICVSRDQALTINAEGRRKYRDGEVRGGSPAQRVPKVVLKKLKLNSVALSPRAEYTD